MGWVGLVFFCDDSIFFSSHLHQLCESQQKKNIPDILLHLICYTYKMCVYFSYDGDDDDEGVNIHKK